MTQKGERILVDGLHISSEIVELDYDARRDQLTAEATGESAILAEPMESLVWAAVGRDPMLEGPEGARVIMGSLKRLRPFFEQFAEEQATGSGPTPSELSERLRQAIEDQPSA